MSPPKLNDAHMTAEQVERLCPTYFQPPHFAYLTQVRNGTGFSRRRTRTADAIAMGTWPSRGIYLHGIEIKVSHSDFLAELKNPEKAEEIAQYCHFWWLAVSSPRVAPLAEVPPNWGLLVVDEERTGMVVLRQATKKDAHAPDHLLMAAVLRRVGEDFVHKDHLENWKERMRAQLETQAKENHEYTARSNTEKIKELLETIRKVEDALGISIDRWSADRFATYYALAKKISENKHPILNALKTLSRVAKDVDKELMDIEKALETV